MNKCIKPLASLLACTLLLSGCSSRSPKEWLEKETEMGTAYGEQLKAGNYPKSWSTFGELEDFAYKDGHGTNKDAFEGVFKVSDTLSIRLYEYYDGKGSGDKVSGTVEAIVYSEPREDTAAVEAVKESLTKAYGSLDWVVDPADESTYASIEAKDVEYKSVFTADLSDLPYLEMNTDEGVGLWDDGFQTYFNAVKEVLYYSSETAES